jgi:hypothetical protein
MFKKIEKMEKRPLFFSKNQKPPSKKSSEEFKAELRK